MDTFSPPKPPSDDSTFQPAPRLINNSFGDGYEQTAPDGLNANPYAGTVNFKNLQLSEANAILYFIDTHVGQVFYWTMPGENTPRKWAAKKGASRTWTGALMNISIPLTERFDLA